MPTIEPARGRKVITVLFADLVGSTRLVAGEDPEVFFERVLRPVIDLLTTAARHHGGTVGQMTGDGLMVLFGAPVAQEDHALAACCAALAMRSALAAAMPELRLRIGINSGEVVVHAYEPSGTIEAAGETMHLAARLQQHADPGAIWVSAPTLAIAGHRVTARSVGAVELRGFPGAIETFALERADPSLTRLDLPPERMLSPFVDRRQELAALEEAFAQAASGAGRAVALVGEAGAGKSRILREFLSRIGGAARIIQGRCTRWREDAAFHPLRPMLRRTLGRGEDAFPLERRDAGAGDEEAIDALLDPARLGKAWAALDPAIRGRRMIAAAAETLLSAAASGPAVLVLDDLHWTDPETERVIGSVLERIGSAPVLLLLGWRPDRAPSWADGGTLTVVPVQPLSAEDARTLAAELLGPGAGEAASRAAERGAGNPLFIEAEVEALRDPAAPRVPATTRGLIAERIDRLGEDEKAVLEALAVLGDPADETMIAAVLDTAETAIGPAAVTLARGGLARLAAIPGFARWECGHALYQDVAYIGMTLARRRLLHGRAAAALMDAGTGEPETLARHARLGELWSLALRQAREAGRRAAARNANRTAVGFFSDALDALERLPQDEETLALAVDLRFDMRQPLHRLGRIAELRARLDEAGAPAERLGDPARLGQLHIHTALHAWLAGAYQDALAACARALALAEETGDAALRLRAIFQRGLAHIGLLQMDEAAEEMAEVAAGAEHPSVLGRYGLDRALAATALSYRVRALADAERFAEAEETLATALATVSGDVRPFNWIFVRIAEGFLHWRRGDAEAARGPLREAVRLCDEAEADLMRPVALGFLGAAEVGCGEVQAGVTMLERAVTLAAGMGFMFQQDLRTRLLEAAVTAMPRDPERVRAARAAERG